jgi:hypothetical protein
VTQAELCGEVAVIGLAVPNAMKPYVNEGCEVGHRGTRWTSATPVYVMRAAVDGTLQPGATEVEAGRLGALPVINGSEILLGPPFIYTAANIDDFDF